MVRSSITLLLLLSSVLVAWGQGAENQELKRVKMEVRRMPDLNIARASHSIFYANGELTVVGGHTAGFVPTATAEYYKDGAWHLVPTVYPHDNGMVVELDGGKRVLLAGGHEKNLGIGQTFEAEMYYPETHTFDGFSCLDRRRAFSQGIELDNGEVLIVGNHTGNDAFELFDGNKTFRHYKDVSAWHSAPYVLPISGGDVIVFGSVWEHANACSMPYDTVDRMKGTPFRAPLLGEWMPMWYDQNNHASESFIGDEAKGDYSYIIAAFNDKDEITFIHIKDTQFSQIPTTHPIPNTIGYGPITNWSPAIADRKAHIAYLVGLDSTDRAYVIAVEYDKRPAPITVYYSDPLEGFGNSTPILTPEGDLIVAGGITNSNFYPYSAVWLLRVGNDNPITKTITENNKALLWVLFGLLMGTVIIVVIWKRKAENGERKAENGERKAESGERKAESGDNELMGRIIELMESEKMYLKPDLQVGHIADALGVHRNTLSACINSHKGCSFSQFVNNYRLQHAKQLLRDNPDIKISAVGLDSGFANERSFFRAFKTATGMTPGEWAKRVES